MRIFFCLFFLASLAFWIFNTQISLSPSDFMKNSESKKPSLSTKQTSEGNRKDIWIVQAEKEERSHITVSSRSSEVRFKYDKGKMETIEQFHDLRGSSEGQTVTAAEGVYSYRSRIMKVQKGIHVETPTASFSAEEATIQLTPSYECASMVAQGSVQISTKDGFTAEADQANLCKKVLTLYSNNPSHYFSCSQKDARATGRNPAPSGADQGQLSFQSQSLPEGESHCLQAGVLQRFILADRCTYFLSTRKALLESIPPHRVLFWQKNGQTMSAPKIEAQLNGSQVTAFGDVHCSFTLQEENLLHKFFTKDL